LTDLNAETRTIWDRNAAFWDERMTDGNDFQKVLVGPATERLLSVRPDELILEIACGNGVMARRLAELGARVVATDFAPDMIERARARGDLGGSIEYRIVDATKRAELLELGAGRFDGVVCGMALMDMAEIDPLMEAIPALLKPAGRFVFSLTHPCFNSSGCTRMVEETDDGDIRTVHAVKVWKYRTLGAAKGLAMRGQPVPQYYFNRTLAELFGSCFRAGMVVDGVEEPAFPPRTDSPAFIHWNLFAEIPPVLAVRARPATKPYLT
jgi:2-polyprenyl-3-methyl-5-hydroxy-6-metoxy-1,4-benzoquinol methylase